MSDEPEQPTANERAPSVLAEAELERNVSPRNGWPGICGWFLVIVGWLPSALTNNGGLAIVTVTVGVLLLCCQAIIDTLWSIAVWQSGDEKHRRERDPFGL